jgi:hypothetical protein
VEISVGHIKISQWCDIPRIRHVYAMRIRNGPTRFKLARMRCGYQ